MSNDFDALIEHVIFTSDIVHAPNRSRQWSDAEDEFLRANLGWMTDEEIGSALGRSKLGVHLRWTRDLRLSSPSKAPDVITAHRAARLLGLDGHTTASWVDLGFIPGRLMAGGRKIRLIRRRDLKAWACNPMNWPYFHFDRVKDPQLLRLIELRKQRWGDEWWGTPQVAEYHHVDVGDVKRYIKLGYIKAYRLPISLGGRHMGRKWSNWFVLRSEATRPDLHFKKHGDGHPGWSSFTPAADAWILRAKDELGYSHERIAKTMKRRMKVIAYRYRRLKTQREVKNYDH